MEPADSPYALLLRHFEDWARAKQRHVDADLLDELLHLRSSYDELDPTYWPHDSVDHLLLVTWPSKGSVEPPDTEVLVETLDAYFRFLRSTGRMSGRSADPKELTKEARRAARKMPEVAADVSNWSPTKVLMDFGRGLGIDVDNAPDSETLQARLAQITELWNSLPEEERRRRMPGPDLPREPHVDGSLTGRERAMRVWDVDDPLLALVLAFRDRLPRGELPPPDVVAPLFRQAPYLRQMLELVDWVGAGKEITATRVLRPALAHRAWDELGLGGWTLDQLRRQYPDERLPGVAAVGRDAWIDREFNRPWRRAADCEELHRLWLGAAACHAIELDGKRAIAVEQPHRDDERWVSTGVRSCVGVMNLVMAETPYLAAPLVYGLLASYVDGRRAVGKDEILDFLVDWTRCPDDLDVYAKHDVDVRLWTQPQVGHALGKLADTGLFVETADSMTLTEAGDVFVTALLKAMERP